MVRGGPLAFGSAHPDEACFPCRRFCSLSLTPCAAPCGSLVVECEATPLVIKPAAKLITIYNRNLYLSSAARAFTSNSRTALGNLTSMQGRFYLE